MMDRVLAIHPNGDTRSMPGVVTREPTYGLPAIWIEGKHREAAQAAKFTLVEPEAVLMTHLTEILQREAAALLTRGETDKLLAELRKSQPGLVEEVIPTLLTVGDVQKVLQALLREKVSIRNMEAIMETLADAARSSKTPATLTEAVRQRLGPAICQALLGDASTLNVLTLDASLEHSLGETARQSESGKGAPLHPPRAQHLLSRLALASDRMMKSNLLPVLLCAPELRRPVRALVERAVPHMRVLSLVEVPNAVSLKSFAVVSVATPT
jgi:flagellar biosynthesis protein FlhA